MIESAECRVLRFNFELEEINDIPPWGEGDNKSLHWFGLTLGHYWISTPLGDVLRYTDEQLREWEDQSPYVDYQVARIFEDIQSVLPSALEPVPVEIAALIEEGGWVDLVGQRLKSIDNTDEQNGLYELFWDATEWYGDRSIDTAYMVGGPNFCFCRLKDDVNFRWRTKAQRWCLPRGQFTLPAQQFESAAYSFFDNFLAETQKRVETIATTGWHRTDCKVDVPLLVKEQQQRTNQVEDLRKQRSETDWAAVSELVGRISGELSIPSPLRR
ncbi:DUF5984 family protein [Occallatibacter savannae]|uniref:DUF5984 family protein n=1 Tax=Occallatibacter savannae TaxID=1002691 RepID=UPI000D68DF04|nr:DUF5984 family protein [Occallatibacter savannae]